MTEPAASILNRGRAAWPGLTADPEKFAKHLERLGNAGGDHPDLWLAYACAAGDSKAHSAFDQQILCDVASYVARIDPSPSFADEVRQSLRERLLVASKGELPRIADYSGRGPLGAWVRVAAVRVAIDLRGKNPDHEILPSGSSSGAVAMATELDPELAIIRQRYQGEYQEALRTAVGRLTPKERNLLRMHVVDGLSIDRIGLAYQVHRATAARWVQAVRQRMLEETYGALQEKLKLSPSEFESLAAVVQSQLHMSLSNLLR
jgi:RNA polymerase sigma-70 factor (ECF subfamily)